MAKRKTRKERKRLTLISIVFLGLVVFLSLSVYKDFKSIIKNKNSIDKLTSEYESLMDENAKLKSETAKLQDPAYIARYAKEKYLYSKEGELIIRID